MVHFRHTCHQFLDCDLPHVSQWLENILGSVNECVRLVQRHQNNRREIFFPVSFFPRLNFEFQQIKLSAMALGAPTPKAYLSRTLTTQKTSSHSLFLSFQISVPQRMSPGH